MDSNEVVKRKVRGPGKRPKLFCTSIRLTQKTMEYFNTVHPSDKQAAMRRILDEYVEQQLKQQELANEPQ